MHKKVQERSYLLADGRVKFRAYLLKPIYWPVWAGLGVLWLLVQMPYKLHLLSGKFIGKLFYLFAKERRHIAEVNLGLCFPELTDEQRREILKKNCESAGLTFFETGIAWWWAKNRYKKLCTVKGLEHLENAKHEGKGVILMAGHFTTLEIGGGAIAPYCAMDALFRMHRNHAFDYVQAKGRCSHNPQSRVIARQNFKEMIRSLRQGRVVWHAPDQDFGRKNSVFVNLFGVPAATITSTSRLAKLGSALVIPMTQKRLEDGSGYLITIHPPIREFPAESDEKDAQLVIDFVERSIRQAPDQYMWMHRRFKTRPEGESSVY